MCRGLCSETCTVIFNEISKNIQSWLFTGIWDVCQTFYFRGARAADDLNRFRRRTDPSACENVWFRREPQRIPRDVDRIKITIFRNTFKWYAFCMLSDPDTLHRSIKEHSTYNWKNSDNNERVQHKSCMNEKTNRFTCRGITVKNKRT